MRNWPRHVEEIQRKVSHISISESLEIIANFNSTVFLVARKRRPANCDKTEHRTFGRRETSKRIRANGLGITVNSVGGFHDEALNCFCRRRAIFLETLQHIVFEEMGVRMKAGSWSASYSFASKYFVVQQRTQGHMAVHLLLGEEGSKPRVPRYWEGLRRRNI